MKVPIDFLNQLLAFKLLVIGRGSVNSQLSPQTAARSKDRFVYRMKNVVSGWHGSAFQISTVCDNLFKRKILSQSRDIFLIKYFFVTNL